jgi:tetratricopeptide (TPR) repeat protein
MSLYNVGKFKEAILFFKKAIRIDPKPPGIYLNLLGLGYLWTLQNEEAIAVFKKLVSREPKNAYAHALLGVALIAAGKHEEAVLMLDKALSLNPNGPGWYTGALAVARASTGQPEEAITILRQALRVDPDNAHVYRYLSLLLSYEGKHEESLSMAKNALSLKKKSTGPMP